MNTVVLAGCTPTPLANYLKALGVLRLLAARHREIRGSWRADRFVLDTALDEAGVLDFFLSEYEPTPIMAPWNGGSGFFEKDNKEALHVIRDSADPRLATYRECLALTEQLLGAFDRKESPKEDAKVRLLSAVRAALPEAALDWFDAAVLLAGDGAKYPPLLGTGGNDGRLDFTNNFMQRLTETMSLGGVSTVDESRAWLKSALFGDVAPGLVKKPIGQFAPGQAGGPNAGNGFESDAAINPWDFVLMIEGALMFAAAAARRSAEDPSGVLSFPFTVRAVGAGAGNLGSADAGSARGELWMPLWQQPATLAEVRALLSEGRVALHRKPARDALDFVRAVHHLGGYRGVHSFQRFGLLMRSGKAYLATPVARIATSATPSSGLADELDRHDWLDRFRWFTRDDKTAKRFVMLRRQLEDRLFELSGGEGNVAAVESLLSLLGDIQHSLAASSKAREAVAPIPLLSERWVSAADDGTPEFRIAKALAGLRGAGDVALPLRAQIYPVQRQFNRWLAPDDGEKARICTGSTGRFACDLSAWLQRRLWLMDKLQMPDKPLSSAAGAELGDVTAFLESERMDARIAALLPGLSLCEIPRDADRSPAEGTLSTAFALMKLVLATDREMRSLGRLGSDECLPVPAGMLAALLAGNHGNGAVALAWRRLRSAGMTPLMGRPLSSLPGLTGIAPARAAAALLIPLRWQATAALARAALAETTDEHAATTAGER